MKNLSMAAAALLICILTTATAAMAQEEKNNPDQSFLSIPAGNWIDASLTGVVPETFKYQEKSPDCPANSMTFTFHYPKGLQAKGNGRVDNEVSGSVQSELVEAINEFKEGGACGKDICGGASCGEWISEKTFAVHTPSSGYLSILFTEFSDTGGAHPNTEYRVMNFRPDGENLTLEDVFSDPAKSVPLYWDYVYAKWCAEHPDKFPLHYATMQDCGTDSPDNPNTYEGAKTLDDLGRLVFTSFGATLVLGPYESGSYASGTVMLDLPKEDLIKMGADPAVWGSK